MFEIMKSLKSLLNEINEIDEVTIENRKKIEDIAIGCTYLRISESAIAETYTTVDNTITHSYNIELSIIKKVTGCSDSNTNEQMADIYNTVIAKLQSNHSSKKYSSLHVNTVSCTNITGTYDYRTHLHYEASKRIEITCIKYDNLDAIT